MDSWAWPTSCVTATSSRPSADLLERGAELGRVERHGVAGRLGQPGVLLDREHAQRELGAAGGDARLFVLDLDLDGPGRQRLHYVGHEAGREHTDAVLAAGDALGQLDGDRQLEVVPGQCQDVTAQLGADARQDGECTAAAGGGSAGGAERIDENVSLASELHAVARFLYLLLDIQPGVVVGPVDCGLRAVPAGGPDDGRPRVVPRLPQPGP